MNCIFFGTPGFAASQLRALQQTSDCKVGLVVTNPDRAAGRGGAITASPVKQVALELGIPVLQPNSIKKELPRFIEQVTSYGPFDVGVVVAYGAILPLEVLNLPKAGCVNVHASLLPRWRGAAPIQRAVMAGDKETGVCLMRMEAGLDTGPVYVSEKILIASSDTSGSLHDSLSALGATLLQKHILDIAEQKITATSQSEEGVTYAHKISNQEASIDWCLPVETVKNHIHGLSPAPGAYSMYNGQRIKIFSAKVIPGAATQPAGTILTASGYDLRIACGEGVLAPLELQMEGKKRLPIEEFLKSGALTPNTAFK